MVTSKEKEAYGSVDDVGYSTESDRGLTSEASSISQKSKKWHNPFAYPKNTDLLCGLFSWKPKWIQVCNNVKMFMFCYVCLGVFQGMMHQYFGTVLPSIERRFGFTSEAIGVVKTMNDASRILTALLIAHYGGAGHRPRWIAAGTFVVGLGFLLIAAPEIIFPVTSHSFAGELAKSGEKDLLCVAPNDNSTAHNGTCKQSTTKSDHMGALIVLGIAEFLIGIGSTTSMVLGLPFVDDNVKAENTPMYFAVSFCGHIFGPLIGIGLGAVFNNIYFDFSKPDFKSSDPRWISAWYLGFIVSGIGTCIFALTIGCFPAKIPKKHKAKHLEEPLNEKPPVDSNGSRDSALAVRSPQALSDSEAVRVRPVALKDLLWNLLRLAKNGTFILKLLSQLVNAFVLAGYMQFAQKFMKEQYHLPQSTTSLAGGMPQVFAGFVGIIGGGFLIKRFKLLPRQVGYMMAVSSLVGSACYFSAIGMGCDMQRIVGVDDVADPYTANGGDVCSGGADCSCGKFVFSPICDQTTGKNYVNPCVAGCKKVARLNQTKYYSDCSCTGNASMLAALREKHGHPHAQRSSKRPSHVYSGLCHIRCPNFVLYVVVMCIAKLFMGVPTAGILMLQFRIVDYDLKSLANAVSMILMALFGFMPAPIIVGRLIDSACRLWQTDGCGNKGSCWLYNANDFRWKLHAAVGACRVITSFFDLAVAYRVRNITFDRHKDENDKLLTQTSTIGLVPAADQEMDHVSFKPPPPSDADSAAFTDEGYVPTLELFADALDHSSTTPITDTKLTGLTPSRHGSVTSRNTMDQEHKTAV